MTTVRRYNNSNNNDKQEIGDLLLRVQDELKGLRNLISQDGSKIDLKTLQTTILKAENEIKEKTDHLINQLNSQVKTLPSIEEQELQSAKYGTLENLWDLAKKEKNAAQPRNNSNLDIRPSSKSLVLYKEPDVLIDGKLGRGEQVVDELHEIGPGYKLTAIGPSPGQQVKIERETRALFNPQNTRNRVALSENYSIQLPLIEKKKTFKMSTHLITGSTVEHLATLPLAYRRNPTLIPPAINENEAKHGLLSLMERGLIPTTAKINFEPSPIAALPIKPKNSLKSLSSINLKNVQSNLALETLYKLDPTYATKQQQQFQVAKVNSIKEESELMQQSQKEFMDNLEEKSKTAKSKQSEQNSKADIANLTENSQSNLNDPSSKNLALTMSNYQNSDNLLPPPATPSNALQIQLYDSSKLTHRFIIENSRARTDLPDYVAFKHSFCLRWGSIVTIIKYLEDFCQTYSIDVGYIDGLKVSELSRCIDMDLKPTQEELMETFTNKEEIEKIVKTPGRRFKTKGGHNLAATIIQCAWRRFRDRTAYLKYRKRKWAAGVIALTWLTYCKVTKAREKLKITREKHLENFRIRQKEFSRIWPKLKNSKRVIIHIPSLAFTEAIRAKMPDLTIRESYQMARICDILDENVDVIYVSAIPITEETLQYYLKLLGLRSAVKTSNITDQADFSQRYKIVIPEALNSFPTHNMALSTLLKYSPKALERIKNLIKGRDAYIVPNVMNHDDLHVADMLNVPILGCEPEISNLYSTKSGSKRIFQSAKVQIPFGEFDIYNKDQLHECLAQVITEHLTVRRWLFKLDDEFDGRGIAYCDISKHLSCYNWALKEMARYGDKWSKRWAHESAYVKILEEIPEVLAKYGKPVNTQSYPTWDDYQRAFLSQGGVIEAHPPSDSITGLTVSVLIEPDHSYKILSSGDHIHAESQYSCWGLSFPQTSIDPAILNEACLSIIDACKQRKIFGYLDIDFITFIDSQTEKQLLWATDLSIYHSEYAAMRNLLYYMSNGVFDPSEHIYRVAAPAEKSKQKSGRSKHHAVEKNDESLNRFAIMSTKLYHTNLAVIHYSVFFQTCRALGIGYDIKFQNCHSCHSNYWRVIRSQSFSPTDIGLDTDFIFDLNLFAAFEQQPVLDMQVLDNELRDLRVRMNAEQHEKQGTIFALIDSLNHVHLGMLTITDNLQSAMEHFSLNLNSLHHEISSENMQGHTNFLMAAHDIRNILNCTIENTEENNN